LRLKHVLRPLLRDFSYYTSFPLVRPTNVVIYITDRCQLRCTTCSKWTTPERIRENELTTEEWKKILLQLKDWLGFYTVFFCGGEPFLRDDLLELIDFAAEQNIPSSVITNGYDLEPFAEAIVRSRLASLHVSLNGVTSEVHDASRGTPGSLEKTKNAILKINQLRTQRPGEKLWLNIETILMPQNVQEILSLIAWAKEQKLNSIDVQLLEDRQTFYSFSQGKSLRHPTDYQPPSSSELQWNNGKGDTLMDVLDELIRQKRKGGFIATPEAQLHATKAYLQNPKDILRIQCRVGVDSFIIDAYGNVRLCMNMSPIGSLLERSPKHLWFSQSARLQRCKIKQCQMFCRLLSCNFSD
ncbi:MAG: radical SAM protein, partial [bacterium]|nr:radical SAM protein [bacterium]